MALGVMVTLAFGPIRFFAIVSIASGLGDAFPSAPFPGEFDLGVCAFESVDSPSSSSSIPNDNLPFATFLRDFFVLLWGVLALCFDY